MRTPLHFEERPFVDDTSPFNLRPSERLLRMVLDHSHIRSSEMLQILDGFSRHKALWIVSTDPQHRHPIVIDREESDLILGSVRVGDITYGAGFTNVEQWKTFGRKPVLKDNFVMPAGPWQDAEYRFRQYGLVKIAESLDADVLVTDDPFLLDCQRPGFLQLPVIQSSEAVELMGSFLRNHGDFTVQMQPGYSRDLGRFLFYLVWSRDLLPRGWRWFSACVESDRQTDGDLVSLGSSTFTRVQQALKARDSMHWQSFRSAGNAGADDVLFYLDMVLVSLAAAFDVVARVADVALGLGSRRHNISWRRNDWRIAVGRVDPNLNRIMASDSENGRIHDLLSRLRNSVHGEALDSLQYHEERRAQQLLIIPRRERAETEALLDLLGGREAWGYHDFGDDYGCIQPGRFVELLLPRAIRAIDDIMAATPVQCLPGVTPELLATTQEPDMDFWDPQVRRAIRVLGGI